MFAIKVDGEGYFSEWFYNEKYDDDKEPGYNTVPVLFSNEDEAYEIAKNINQKTGKEVNIKRMVEEHEYTFPSTKLTLKDLKRGETFQYLTNLDCIFMVVSDKEIVCVKGCSFRYIGQFFNITEYTKNYEVKKVKL